MTIDTALGHLFESWALDSPSDKNSTSSLVVSHAVKSPGGRSQQHSNAGFSSSRSPGSVALILTPTSTIPDSFGDVTTTEGLERDSLMTSSESVASCWDEDYVLVPNSNDQADIRWSMDNRPPTSSALGYPALGVNSLPLHQSLGQRLTTPLPRLSYQWSSSNPGTNATGRWMDSQHSGQFGELNALGSYTFDDETIITTQALADDLISGYTILPEAGSQIVYDSKLPFQSVDHRTHAFSQSQYAQYAPQANVPPHNIESQTAMYPQSSYQQPLPQGFRPSNDQQTFQAMKRPMQSSIIQTQQYIQPPTHEPQFQQAHPRHPHLTQSNLHLPITIVPATATRRLQPTTLGSSATVARAQNEGYQRKGGRQRGKRLPEGARNRSHKMRQAGACWRCVLQRDPVSICYACGSACADFAEYKCTVSGRWLALQAMFRQPIEVPTTFILRLRPHEA